MWTPVEPVKETFPRAQGDEAVVVIMAKAPVPGTSKTRLSPPLSPQQAADLQAALLRDSVALAQRAGKGQTVLFCPSPGAPGGWEALHLVAAGLPVVVQCSSGLGPGLLEAATRAAAAGYGKTLLLDADSPTVPPGYLELALAHLDERDMVLGPAEDGGYYLLGLKQPHPCLFQGIPWSTPTVTDETLAAARAHGLCVGMLPAWYDVDTPQDVTRLRADLAHNPGSAPATWALLQELLP